MVTPRPGGGAGVAPREQADPDETKAFNTDLMSRM